MLAEWQEILPGVVYRLEVDRRSGSPPNALPDPPMRAHIQVHSSGKHVGAWWWIDGDDHMRHSPDVSTAKAVAEEFLRGLGFELKTGNSPGRAQGSRHEAEPAGVTTVPIYADEIVGVRQTDEAAPVLVCAREIVGARLVYGEDGVDDDRALAAGMAVCRRLYEGLERDLTTWRAWAMNRIGCGGGDFKPDNADLMQRLDALWAKERADLDALAAERATLANQLAAVTSAPMAVALRDTIEGLRAIGAVLGDDIRGESGLEVGQRLAARVRTLDSVWAGILGTFERAAVVAEQGSGVASGSPRGLLSRISESAPAQLRDELRSRARQVETLLSPVRELAAGEADDPELVAVLQAEAAGAARELAEAGVEVLRELRRDLAVAEAIEEAHRADLDAARERTRSIEAAIRRVHEKVLRPACEAAGAGDTRRLTLATARVAIWKNPPKVEIEEGVDAHLFDERYQRVTIEPDREAIKAALSTGEAVPGCRLVTTTRIEVR